MRDAERKELQQEAVDSEARCRSNILTIVESMERNDLANVSRYLQNLGYQICKP